MTIPWQQARFPSIGPKYIWRAIVHPYSAAAFLSFLLIVPYCFPFTLPPLFPAYRHYASLDQHLLVSIAMSLLIFGGVAAGLVTAAKPSSQTKLENIHFLSSNTALAVFGGCLLLSWMMSAAVMATGVMHMHLGPSAARESMKSLGGLSFIARLFSVALLPVMIGRRLRGRPVAAVLIVTVILATLQSFATEERFVFVQLFIVLGIYVALYRPQTLRPATALIACFLGASVLAGNLALRVLGPAPPALRPQIERLLPEIALGTFLTYPADTTNKLYFQLFENIYDRNAVSGFYLGLIRSFTTRFTGQVVLHYEATSPLAPTKNAYRAGKMSSLDFQHGRNRGMTNPGGPTEDFIDFGFLFPAVLFLKFFVFARVYAGARRFDPLCVALYPSFLAAALDYSQVNMLYEVAGGMPVVLALVLVPLARWVDRAGIAAAGHLKAGLA
jgi:hypothetical protein